MIAIKSKNEGAKITLKFSDVVRESIFSKNKIEIKETPRIKIDSKKRNFITENSPKTRCSRTYTSPHVAAAPIASKIP